MPTVKRFEDLEIWQLARLYYQKISPIAKRLRKAGEFRFAEQIKSAAGSIMDNTAEGFERSSRLEFLYSLGVAKGEAGESKSQVYRLSDDEYINKEEFADLYESNDKLSRKIANFVKYLNQSEIKGLKFKDRTKAKESSNLKVTRDEKR
jgi:four helix bundle protein